MKNIYSILIALLVLAGCSNNEVLVDDAQYQTISASMEQDQGKSRLVVDQLNTMDWTIGDVIRVFLNNGSSYDYEHIGNGLFGPKGQAVPNTTTNDDVIGVLYEGGDDEGSWINGSIANNKLESGFAQNVTYLTSPENTINLPMWGTWDNGHVSFKHLAGILRLDLTGLPVNYDLLSVEASNPICGTFVVEDVTVNNPVLEVAPDSGEKLITIRFSPVTSTTQNKIFYVPLPVGTYDFIKVQVSKYDENLPEGEFDSPIELFNWQNKTVERATIYTASTPVVIENKELSAALLGELGSDKVTINADGYAVMKEEDVLAVRVLDFSQKYTITSLKGIEQFSNLWYLSCNYTGLKECDLKRNKALQTVYVCGSSLEVLDLSGLTALEDVACAYSSTLEELIITDCDKLGHLEAMDTQLTSIEFSNPDVVWQLICGGNENLQVDLTKYPNLTVLGLRSMGLTEVNIPDNLKSQLTWLCFEKNKLTSIDLSEYPNLEMFGCYGNELTSLDLSAVSKLKSLQCGENKINNLDITCLPDLESLYCAYQIDVTLTLKLTEAQKAIWDSKWLQDGNSGTPVNLDVVTTN